MTEQKTIDLEGTGAYPEINIWMKLTMLVVLGNMFWVGYMMGRYSTQQECKDELHKVIDTLGKK